MYDRRKLLRRSAVDIAIGILILALLAVLLNAVQTDLSVRRQESNSLAKLDIARQRLAKNTLEADEDLRSYDAFGKAKLDVVAWFLQRDPTYAGAADFARRWGLTALYTVDSGRRASEAGAPDFTDYEAFGALFTGGAATVDGLRYYASPRAGGGYYVGARDFSKEDTDLAELRSPGRALRTIKVGLSGYIFAVDTATGVISYHPDPALIGRDAADAGWDPALYPAGYDGWLTLGGARLYCISQAYEGTLLVAAIPQSELSEYNRQMVGLMLAVFAVALALLIAYALMLRKESLAQAKSADDYLSVGGKLYLDTGVVGKLKYVALIGLTAVFAVSFFMQTLTALSRQSMLSEAKLASVGEILDDNRARIDALTREYDEEYSQRARNIAYTLAQDPSLVADDMLALLAERAQISSLHIFDARGRTVATNSVYKDFVLSTVEGEQSYPFWDVVKGYKDVLVQQARLNEFDEYMQYVGVARVGEKGMVELGISPKRLKSRLMATELDYVLGGIAVENGGMLFAVDIDTGCFLSYPTKKYIGRAAAEYGLTASAMRDEYTGYQTIDSAECFVNCMQTDSAYIYVAIPTAGLFGSRLTVSAVVTAAGLVAMLLISLLLMFGGKPGGAPAPEDQPDAKPEAQPETQPEAKENRYFKLLMPGGRARVVQSADSRWAGTSQPWRDMTPEQKLMRLAKLLLSVVALALVAYLWFGHGQFQKGSMLGYILSQKWERTPNLFSLTYTAVVLLEVAVCATLARRLIRMVTRRFGARSETVGRLLDSFVKYGAVIGAVFYCLSFLGIDSATLLTSAGILSLVVGLGAQSLISDILAGVFIVFEGEFRVGDIVTIGDWRGTVMEIGIRTTKIESGGKDIKIFNNSAISGVINMTKQHSYAFADIGVEYGESLERVESVLNKELPGIKERLPSVVNGPFYRGVASLAESSVNIRIVAQCEESDRIQLTRDLNRELKLIFDRNGINIPFPQIVVNQPVEHEKATRKEKKQAAEFVDEQKELTKDIHVQEDL